MKSKFYFEPSDFVSGGQMIIRQACSTNCKDIAFMCSVSYKIGWKSNLSKGNSVIKISLSDGMCIEYENEQVLCDKLNSDEQGYRPMTQQEINSVMNYCGNRFNG